MTAFDKLATRVADAAGTPQAMALFVAAVVLWLAVGPLLGFSNGWQLLINTPTTIVTTGLVILVQYTTNKGDRAIQLKLDVLIDASQASNRYATVEDLDDKALRELHQRVAATVAEREGAAEGGLE